MKTDLKLKFGLWGINGIVLMSLVLLQGQNYLLTEFGIHYRLETCKGVLILGGKALNLV